MKYCFWIFLFSFAIAMGSCSLIESTPYEAPVQDRFCIVHVKTNQILESTDRVGSAFLSDVIRQARTNEEGERTWR
ncbi:MAG: hypothetical protein AAF193_09750 [Bacteroidota bacterium]